MNKLSKRVLLIAILLLPILPAYSNANPPDFELVTKEDLEKTICDIDSTAPAAYLSDKGRSSFFYDDYQGFMIRFERKSRIQIYKKDGLEYADVVIPLYKKDNRSMEVLKEVVAYTYNLENGSVLRTKLSPGEVYEEDLEEKYILKKFTLPKAQVGSIIDIYYKVESPFVANLEDWNFQKAIPVKLSMYEVYMPPFFEYAINKKGSIEIKNSEPFLDRAEKRFNGMEYKDMNYKWMAKDIPAFYEEAYMTAKSDYISKVEFQLTKINYPNRGSVSYMSSWEELIKRLTKESSFGRFLKMKVDKNLISQITAGLSDDIEKAKAIHKYVKENYKWDGDYGMYPSDEYKDFEMKREGNCTAINLTLLNMLDAAGIEAYPLLISTRDNGLVDFNYPFIDEFNYTAIVISNNDNYVLVDATRRFLPFAMLPYECRNGRGLLVKKNTSFAITLSEKGSLYRVVTFSNILYDAETETLKAKVNIAASLYAAVEYREIYGQGEDVFKKKIIESEQVEDLSIRNLDDDLDEPFRITYTINLGDASADMLYINPIVFGKITENPFKHPVRTYPVDYSIKTLYEFRTSFAVPEGFELMEYPESDKFQIAEDKVGFSYNSSFVESVKQFQLSNTLLIASPVVEPEYYQDLKSLYTDIINKLEQPIIIKRISKSE
ncbi:DUF3857 domain-containing protein [Chondrinema litorale]|uniref:DUF3857 domain-containing protein n=1 Tax=Chondrinema litorale TaxID=2994555 RepID=UPI002544A88E|nr:DUF3857 domain-containing protein [Chondrinema litorale]UZR94397.1 DUF3857 domain-containing protein [Chondrinema litorale]